LRSGRCPHLPNRAWIGQCAALLTTCSHEDDNHVTSTAGRLLQESGLRTLKRGIAVTGKVDASLRKLSSVSENLNQVSDQLSAQLESIESALNNLKLGVFAWVQVSKESHFEPGLPGYVNDVVDLGYGRHKGRWALLFDDYCEEIGNDGSGVGFLRDAPRETRISAVGKIPELLEKLAEETTKLTEKASQGVSEAREIAQALSKGRS